METQSGSVNFSLPLRGYDHRTRSQTVVFPGQLASDAAGLSGLTMEFSGGDCHIGTIEINLHVRSYNNILTVVAHIDYETCQIIGDIDYGGHIEFSDVTELGEQA